MLLSILGPTIRCIWHLPAWKEAMVTTVSFRPLPCINKIMYLILKPANFILTCLSAQHSPTAMNNWQTSPFMKTRELVYKETKLFFILNIHAFSFIGMIMWELCQTKGGSDWWVQMWQAVLPKLCSEEDGMLKTLWPTCTGTLSLPLPPPPPPPWWNRREGMSMKTWHWSCSMMSTQSMQNYVHFCFTLG